MRIKEVNPRIKYVYHFTLKENVEKILTDRAIVSKDEYVFFTKSLRDSVTAFENEMMVEGKLYIDVDGNLRKRERCSKDDYCILRIPYINDGKFCEFEFDGQDEGSIYGISLAHKGEYGFEKAVVMDFPKAKNISNIIAKTAVVAMVSGMILFPYKTYAGSWADAGNYDVSWYVNENVGSYYINSAEQMAGLAHLVNEENVSFEGKRIYCNGDIDLTANKWQTISDVFKGRICGAHRILLNGLEYTLFANQKVDNVDYVYPFLMNNSETVEKASVESPYTVADLKKKIDARYVYLNNKKLDDDTVLTSLNFNENDVLRVFDGYHVFIERADGSRFIVAGESGESIDDIREFCSRKTGIPADKIVLKFKDKELADGRTMADYNIQREAVVYMFSEFDEKVPTDEEVPTDDVGNEVGDTENVVKNEADSKENPKTGDGVVGYVAMFVMSVLGLVAGRFGFGKRK